ncbi:MAG TPA: Ger(x)C family spore germination protein [Clostridia bacterium]
MKIVKILLLLLLIANSLFLPGCWNYHDIEYYSIVSGFSIDKNEENNKYILTMEVLDFEVSGKEAKQASKLIESDGPTLLDAIRNVINTTGKKLYWAHANIAIISQDIAREGISPVLDLLYRDNEIREEMDIIISKEKTAKELLNQQTLTSQLRSNEIYKMLESQTFVAKAPEVKTYELVNTMEDEGISPALPLLGVRTNMEKRSTVLMGTAVLKFDKLAGFLDMDETKNYLLITNQVDKGLLIPDKMKEGQRTSLEILVNKTKVWPELIDGKLSMNIEIKPEVAIAEVGKSVEYSNAKERDSLKKSAEETLKSSMLNTIGKVQKDYDSDIFGFGRIVKMKMPSLWKRIDKNWDNIFRDLAVNVDVDITIKNSAHISKPITKRD